MKFVKLYELKIFTAEDVLCGDEPFYKAVFKEARRLGLGGGTMIRADAGYGRQIRGNDGRAVPVFFSGSYNLPLIIEIVDTKEKLATGEKWRKAFYGSHCAIDGAAYKVCRGKRRKA